MFYTPQEAQEKIGVFIRNHELEKLKLIDQINRSLVEWTSFEKNPKVYLSFEQILYFHKYNMEEILKQKGWAVSISEDREPFKGCKFFWIDIIPIT